MTGEEIIAAFGGKHPVASLTGATPNAVTQWRRIGVPAKFWPVLVEHAARAGIPGITFEALRLSKPAPPPTTPEQPREQPGGATQAAEAA